MSGLVGILGNDPTDLVEPCPADSAHPARQLQQELGLALERRELLLHYQPVISLRSP